MEAWERGDVEAVTAMLAEDAAITMPPMASWFRGEGVEIFLREWAFSGRVYDAEGRRNVRVLPARANGQPAIGTYSWSDEARRAPADRAAGAELRRRPHHGDHRLRRPVRVRPLRPAGAPVSDARRRPGSSSSTPPRRPATAEVPWYRGGPNPFLEQWVRERALDGAGRRALVIGTALGDDAELLAGARLRRHRVRHRADGDRACPAALPDSDVDYRVADLLELPEEWRERVRPRRRVRSRCSRCRVALRERAIDAIASTVAPGGTLVVVSGIWDGDGPRDGPPWPLTREELDRFERSLRPVSRWAWRGSVMRRAGGASTSASRGRCPGGRQLLWVGKWCCTNVTRWSMTPG